MKQMQGAWILGAAMTFTVFSSLGQAQQAPEPAAADSSAPQKNIQLVGARATLSKTLDAKKLKQGDPVTAKLQDDIKASDSSALPKNTILVGHVDQVQASENKSDSSIQVTFDKAQLKSGQQLPIKATIMQIAPPPTAMAMSGGGGGSAPSAMPSGPAPSSAGGGGGASGGGMQGGSSAPQPSPSMASSAPDGLQQPASQQAGVSSVNLQSDIHEQNSGTFTSKGKNVHLDGGTQMQMAVAVVPANMQIK